MAAEDLLNYTGLTYFKQKCDTEYATKDEAADHPIETVKVNGTALTPDANKSVNVQTPYTDTGEDSGTGGTYYSITDESGNTFYRFVTSDNGFLVGLGTGQAGGGTTKELVDKTYVDANGGKIDKINVNGTEQTITNKEVSLMITTMTGSSGDFSAWNGKTAPSERVNLSLVMSNDDSVTIETKMPDGNGTATETLTKAVPTKTYVDGTFRTAAQVQTAIDNALSGISGVSFQVVTALPATGENGIFYLVANSGSGNNVYDEYIWVNKGTTENPNMVFEKIGSTAVDLTNYVQQDDINIITTAQIDALFA